MIIIVPAYNEEKRIGRVISGLLEHGYDNIVVIDDGSVDNTAKIAKKAGAMIVRHPINRGQGAALETGNEFARQRKEEQVIHFDGDDQFNALDIKTALEKMSKTDADVVLGSRFLDKRSKLPFLKKYFILPVGRWVNYIFTGISLTDAHNGFRILNNRALQKIKIVQDGMAHNTEIIRLIKKNNLKFIEVSVEVRYHSFGQSVGGGLKIIKDLLFGKII